MKKKILFSLLLGAAILSMVITPVIAAQKVVVKEQEISPEVSTLEPTDLFAPGVTDLLAQGASPVQIIIQTASHEYTQISNLIKSLGGTVSIEYQTINAIAATIPANALIDLTASPDLVKIYSDPLRYLQESVEPIERIAPTDALMGQDPEMIVNPIDIETMEAAPSTFVNPDLTNADQIWFDEDVFFGYGSRVAIIDTGCWHTEWTDPDGGIHRPWYWGNVYGGIDLSYDVGTAYEGYDNPNNHYHGTHCAALLAAHAEIVFGPGHLWADSMLYYYPDAGYYDDGTFIVTQSGTTYAIDLIESTQSAVDFYDYWSASGHTPFMEDKISKIYLYHDTTSGELSLIMHHSIDNSVSGNMRVNFNLEGVPVGAYTALSDDPSHTWNETRPGGREFDLTLEPEGNWYHGANSDGGVISGLPTDESWSITIHPDFIAGITDWQYQTLGDTDIGLTMDEPVTISYIPPRAHIFALGIAPLASIYAVKIFDHTGSGVPSSMVMQGIEAAMIEGVDVISMSLGGGCGAPGADPTDLLVDAATEMGITVVVSAGNEGPAPLRVGSPGTAKTVITVGAAIDPIHHKWAGGIIYGYPPYGELVYYPHDEKSIAYFSSRGPTSDGRTKPDVVATGYHTFGGLTPAYWPYTIVRASGTSFSCPQVAGEAALLAAYIRNNGLSLGPKSIKKAIMKGADPIEGFDAFEQGAGYINCFKSLEILKTMEEPPPHCNYNHRYGCGCGYMPHFWWSPPVETLRLKDGKATVHDVTIDPLKYKYFAFWVSHQVDAIRITLSGVTFAPPEEQGYFGDGAYLYLSSAAREGIDDYLLAAFFGDDPTTDPDEFIFQVVSDFTFQPGVVRLVFEGDWYSLQPFHIDEMTIEVIQVAGRKVSKWMGIYNRGADVAGAQVSIFDGTIYRQRGKIREGEIDLYAFTIPNVDGMAIVELSWKKDWTRWATSDLDLIIFGPDGYINVDGVTGASPEVALVAGAGDYIILIDGYQVYWNRNEKYILRIIYIADFIPKWESEIIALDYWATYICLPKGIHGLAIIWIYDYIFPYPYAADFVKV